MLKIRLSKVPEAAAEIVTIACPDHLVLADLPVAKGIGVAASASIVKSLGRRSRRQPGERVHFCVRCDFPIAIYGRLRPCEHAFCLDCAKSKAICYLCGDRIQKIQTRKLMEGIFICAAPHCLKSFVKRTEFESHIHENHADLLKPNVKQEREENIHQQSREQPRSRMQRKQTPIFGQNKNKTALSKQNNSHSQSQGLGRHRQSSQFSGKQPGILTDTPYPQYPPLRLMQPPNYVVLANSNPMLTPPAPFGYPPFPIEGAQQYYSTPYEASRQDAAAETGSEQGPLLGIPPGAAGGMSFSATYPQSWNNGQAGISYKHAAGGQGMPDAFANTPDSQGKHGFYQGDYRCSPSMANKGIDVGHSGNAMDSRDGKGILGPHPLPPPPPPPPYLSHNKRGKFVSGDKDDDRQGWQNDSHSRDSFGSGQDS